MKKLICILALTILTDFSVNASRPLIENSSLNNGYNNSFIFIENGIEFSVFPDGQFDFNMLRGNAQLNVSVGSPNANISFNSGYDYNAFVQYDEFGAIIQIENTPIFYDYYGRIQQAGNININYNNYGFINRVGGLRVYYNNYNVFSHCSGYINVFNRNYVYRPWHRFYSVPAYNYCVVYNRPYRQNYNPVRYSYTRPFYNNYRPRTAVYSRQGNRIERDRSYATVNRSSSNVTEINRLATINRNSTLTSNATGVRNTNINNNNTLRINRTIGRSAGNNGDISQKEGLINRNAHSNYTTNNSVITTRTSSVNRPVIANTNSRNTEIRRTAANAATQKPTSNTSRIYANNTTNTRRLGVADRSSQQNQTASQRKTSSSNSTNRLANNSNRRL